MTMKKKIGWMVSAVPAVLGGIQLLGYERPAQAHMTCTSAACCSPHGDSKSVSGSRFSNCNNFLGGTQQGVAVRTYSRYVTCAAGTTCANANGCGLGLTGFSWNYIPTTGGCHNGKSNHQSGLCTGQLLGFVPTCN